MSVKTNEGGLGYSCMHTTCSSCLVEAVDFKFELRNCISRGASQDFIKKYPKNTDISPILGINSLLKSSKKVTIFFFSL
jgi:hypothetical protein